METSSELAVKINDFPNATRLAKEAMQVPTIEGQDTFIDKILRDDDDVRVAVWMTKVITKALTNKLQANLKAKLVSNFFNTAMEKRDIDSQVAKIAAAETALISSKGKLLILTIIRFQHSSNQIHFHRYQLSPQKWSRRRFNCRNSDQTSKPIERA